MNFDAFLLAMGSLHTSTNIGFYFRGKKVNFNKTEE